MHRRNYGCANLAEKPDDMTESEEEESGDCSEFAGVDGCADVQL